MVKSKEVIIQSEPFTEKKLNDDLKKIDFVYHLHTSKKKRIKNWLKEHKIERFWDEEIIYIHRYPSTEDTLIGVKRLSEIDYII
jgi:hypothetical protein